VTIPLFWILLYCTVRLREWFLPSIHACDLCCVPLSQGAIEDCTESFQLSRAGCYCTKSKFLTSVCVCVWEGGGGGGKTGAHNFLSPNCPSQDVLKGWQFWGGKGGVFGV